MGVSSQMRRRCRSTRLRDESSTSLLALPPVKVARMDQIGLLRVRHEPGAEVPRLQVEGTGTPHTSMCTVASGLARLASLALRSD